MTEAAKAPAGANAPYKTVKQGGRWLVKNNIGETKISYPGTPDGYKKALAYVAALYRSVPGAAKRAEKVGWTGKAKQRIKAAAPTGLPVVVNKTATVSPGELERRARIAQSVTLPPGMSRHHFLGDADNHCLTCKQIQDHPVHGLDGDPTLTEQLLTDRDKLVPGQSVQVSSGGDPQQVPAPVEVAEPDLPAPVVELPVDVDAATPVHTTRDRVPEPERLHQLPQVRAFLTQVGERTLLTAPASTFTPAWEKALTPNEHMLWMQGNFVGAEKANRNGAFWSTEDLQMGEPTVKHGPLNWLHEARHVIGTIADAKLIVPGAEAAADGMVTEPHIVAMAAVWRWLYQDEACVMEQASDQNKLWYSMECISRQIACTGETGCGNSYPYMVAMAGGDDVCQHIKERSSVRRLVDPTFLGGAVIVPPVRPGWGQADARVLRQAAGQAERAYHAAGEPDMPAAEWEQLMAQVVGWASR